MRDSLVPLGERQFRILFAGRLASFLGSAVAPVALAFAVIDDLDGSATSLGLVLTAGWVPQVLFILIGGVVSDRLPRHLVLVGSNLVSALAQTFAAVMLLTGSAQIWHLVVAQVIRGTAASFFFPASAGLVPQTVPERYLQQANALLRMTTNSAFVIGSAGGGILVAAAGAGWAIGFDALTYLASGLILLAMRIEGPLRSTSSSFVADLREGWGEFRSRQWLWMIVLAALVGNMASNGGFGVLGPIVAEEALNGAKSWGLILAVQAAGLLLGGIVALRLRPGRPLLVGQIAVLFWGAPLLGLALELPTLWIAAFAFVSGIGLELCGVYWDTVLQQNIPHDALSRVTSYDALGSFVAIPVSLSIVGPISDAIGVSATLWGAFVIFLLAQAFPLLSRQVRTLPRNDPRPDVHERITPEVGGLPEEV